MADALPDGYKLCFNYGFRPLALQWCLWLSSVDNKRKNNPNLSDEQIKSLARKTCACPEDGFGPHQTGGAVDLTIVGPDEQQLDMGTPFSDHSIYSTTKYNDISDVAKSNRRMLLDAMESSGFVNYPREWWHYSYGDRAWVAYRRKKCAIFGKTKCPEYKLKPDQVDLLKNNNIHLTPGE
ncbi:D-alanyl-D-alanine carboxypeptidase family protein [Lachnospiraceae bacterium OttesenSCG-928-E19]|nr:D-alanyl-D-alanine carboxypeptidase family protein [Lachnospiraceae bacterium OttesenSCG-928-E19]